MGIDGIWLRSLESMKRVEWLLWCKKKEREFRSWLTAKSRFSMTICIEINTMVQNHECTLVVHTCAHAYTYACVHMHLQGMHLLVNGQTPPAPPKKSYVQLNLDLFHVVTKPPHLATNPFIHTWLQSSTDQQHNPRSNSITCAKQELKE